MVPLYPADKRLDSHLTQPWFRTLSTRRRVGLAAARPAHERGAAAPPAGGLAGGVRPRGEGRATVQPTGDEEKGTSFFVRPRYIRSTHSSGTSTRRIMDTPQGSEGLMRPRTSSVPRQ